MPRVLILSGPTATGKTDMAVALGQTFGAEVVNFDSLLFYRELSIGTAKPTMEERHGVPHHMVDVRSAREPMNAADYAREARPVVDAVLARGRHVVLVGGAGFYLRALVKGMYDSGTTPAPVRARSEELYAREGIAPFRRVLELHDTANFRRLHENDHYRIRRAVEHFWTNGTPFSAAQEAMETRAPPPHGWETTHFHLDIPKDAHQDVIRARTRRMLAAGLVEEVRGLLAAGLTGLEKPLQSIGYKETLDWLNGVYGPDRAAYEERIVINTRRLAKAQRTWFQKEDRRVFDPRLGPQEVLRAAGEFFNAPE